MGATESTENGPAVVRVPPTGLAVLAALGPGLVWCGEYIGSGEVILAPRAGALLGLGMLWVPLVAIFAKFWIGLAGARYTVCTGESMIDMMSRTPGPKNWILWPAFIGQIAAAAIASGALASAAGVFAAYFIPLPPTYLSWAIAGIVIALVWSGRFEVLKGVMSLLVGVIILGVVDVVIAAWPGWSPVLGGLFGFKVPEVAEWARTEGKPIPSAWREMLPLLGWAAGGFASQVWYTYWIFGAGYGMANGRSYGQPANLAALKSLTVEDAGRLKGWCGVVVKDASMAMTVAVIVTGAFAIAGAEVLGKAHIAPEKEQVALELSRLFSERWGEFGARLFVLSALAAFISTLMGHFAGWPRLLADCGRILIPGVSKYSWSTQFRFVIVALALSNMIVVHQFGLQPVFLVKMGAVLDGLVLTPLQAIAVAWVIYRVMPGFYREEVWKILRPSPIYMVGLIFSFLLFSYFCIAQLPTILFGN